MCNEVSTFDVEPRDRVTPQRRTARRSTALRPQTPRALNPQMTRRSLQSYSYRVDNPGLSRLEITCLREGVCGCIMYMLYSCMNVYAVYAVCAYGGRVTVRG